MFPGKAVLTGSILVFIIAGGTWTATPVQAADDLDEIHRGNDAAATERPEPGQPPGSHDRKNGGMNGILSLAGYRGSIGVSFKQVTLDIMEGSDHLVVATIGNEFSPSLIFNLESPVKFFGKSRLGYFLKYEYGVFNLDVQESSFSWEPQWQDMGTSVDGYFISATPVLTMEVSDRSDIKTRINFGIGLGYLSLEGDVIIYLDDDPYQPVRYEVNIHEPALNCYLSLEFLGSKGGCGFKVAWLQGKSEGYHYYLSEVAISALWTKEIG
jgi:hypothetical protein